MEILVAAAAIAAAAALAVLWIIRFRKKSKWTHHISSQNKEPEISKEV